jgi:hypothetical protein
MYLIDVKGTMREILEASPMIEERRLFNGRLIKDIEVTSNNTIKPNGICFKYKTKDIFNNSLYIGNLKVEDVEGIMYDLKTNKVADVSGLTYQKVRFGKDFIFDNGASIPYYIENYTIFPRNNFSPILDEDNVIEKDSAIDKMTDEELRQTIYELGDYTMQQLGNMNRNALLDEYDMLNIEGEGLDE